MKPKILAATLLSAILITSSFCYADNRSSNSSSKQITVSGPFKKILVGEYINLVLIQDASASYITVAGDAKKISYINVSMSNNELSIKSKKNFLNRKITVYVPVKDLSSVELKNGASISGEGALQFDNLTVTAGVNCHVALKAHGDITLKTVDDCVFVFEKNEGARVVYE